MKDNGKAITSMLYKDCVLLVVFLLVSLGINCFVLLETLAIMESGTPRTVVIAIFAVTMLTLAGSMVWVTMHLCKNKDEVYGEDLYYQELIQQQKEGA
jgi:di/tricarboxylate transporter